MLINISEIISTEFKKTSFEYSLTCDSLIIGGQQYQLLRKGPISFSVDNTGGSKVRFHGTVDLEFDIPCGRCLTSVPTPLIFDFDQEIDFDKVRKGELEDLDDISFMEESSLDVDKFLSGEVLMHFPARVLCRKGCKGLCLKCGKNLNEGNCGCDRAVLDPRMSAIRDIFNSYKEV